MSRESTIEAFGSSETDEWSSPSWLLDVVRAFSWRRVIALDPCWNPVALTAPLARFTADDDGLAQDWLAAIAAVGGGPAWINWPYSNSLAWAAKIRAEAARGVEAVSLGRVSTSSAWWHSLVWRSARAVCFLYKRLAHIDEHGVEQKGSMFASAVIYHGVDADRFREFFAPHGAVVVLR